MNEFKYYEPELVERVTKTGQLQMAILLEELRKSLPNKIAEDIIGVQDMTEGGKAFGELYKLLEANPDMAIQFGLSEKPDKD